MIVTAAPVRKVVNGPNDTKILQESARINFGFPVNEIRNILSLPENEATDLSHIRQLLTAWAPELEEAFGQGSLVLKLKFENDTYEWNPQCPIERTSSSKIISIEVAPVDPLAMFMEDHPVHKVLNKLKDLEQKLVSDPNGALGIWKLLVNDPMTKANHVLPAGLPVGLNFRSARVVNFDKSPLAKTIASLTGSRSIATAAPSEFEKWANSYGKEPVKKEVKEEEVTVTSFDDWAKKFM